MTSLRTVVVLCCLLCGAWGLPADFKMQQSRTSSRQQDQDLQESENLPVEPDTWDDSDEPKAEPPKEHCGYEYCNLGKEDTLNVHIVPHTHDDVGWKKTVDQYYYGADTDIQRAGVQYILDTVIQALKDNPERRFIYVEQAFFQRWWREQDDAMRHSVKDLVDQGRLEFILGGWSMNDEAATHYVDIIDQHTHGFRLINEIFGKCGRPKIGWQIDPFGHSREQASLFAQFGFDGLFFGRLDYQDKDKRMKDKTMEMLWMGSANLGDAASLLTGVNYNGYSPPDGFCYDVGCSDPPIMDDERLHDYNVKERVDKFIKAANDQAKHYSTNHIMMTMGSDFQFEDAHVNFKNLDKLIKYVNERQSNGTKINLFYSTPSCYLYALNKANQEYTMKTDDFFPYGSRAHTFWTGYFTSRPALKGYVRQTSSFLQVCKQLDVLSGVYDERQSWYYIDKFKEAQGVAQHHDAVSGTEKQAVAYDYALRLAEGVEGCQKVVNDAFKRILSKDPAISFPNVTFCNHLNISMCEVTEKNDMFSVIAYNPMVRTARRRISIPVSGASYTVMDSSMKEISSQIVPTHLGPKGVRQPKTGDDFSSYTLHFHAEIPALGVNTYFVKKSAGFKRKQQSRIKKNVAEDYVMKNEHLELTFDATTGLLKTMKNLESDITASVSQELMYYKAMAGNNSKDIFQASGAYAFRPDGNTPLPISTKFIHKMVQGELVQEFHQVYDSPEIWASQIIRLYNYSRHAEFQWLVGPIPFKDNIGKEVISRFTTDLDTKGTFYTDSNGREILTRVRDYRPTWQLNQTEEVAGNYYPVNSRIYIRDETKKVQLTVLTDRSQGGGSIHDGQLELMVHRRLLHDDSFGVGEPLNETGTSGQGLIVLGTHYVYLEPIESSAHHHRDLADRLFAAPYLGFVPVKDFSQYAKDYKTEWAGAMTSLPENVRLLTLEQFSNALILLRLEHFYEIGEDAELSKSATVSLSKLFQPFTISYMEELTLGANQQMSEASRLKWKTKTHTTSSVLNDDFEPISDAYDVTLKPMQIRTFTLHVKMNK